MVDMLLVPSVRRGNGSGHLVRCFNLASCIGSSVAVFLPDDPDVGSWSADELRLAYPREMGQVRVIGDLAPGAQFRIIVLDNRATTLAELERWSSRGTVVAIDEGGEARESAAYLVDILPRHPRRARRQMQANIASLGFLSLPQACRDAPTSIKRILVSFGGEDPAGLTDRFLGVAIGGGYVTPDSITVVSGALSRAGTNYPAVTAIGPVQDLKEMLRSYDLVVTQFGLTAFEAAWAGCAVLVLDPGREHEELSMAAGFISLGVGTPSAMALRHALADVPGLVAASRKAAPTERLNLASRLSSLAPRHAGSCPICGASYGTAQYRAERKTYIRCHRCGMIRMAFFAPRKDHYASHSYFFEEYKAQYGRTYLEDMPAIRAMAAKRLTVIESLLPAGHEGESLLDVGCAYGAFLVEAQTRGWSAVGSDVAADAVDYVKSNFNVPAFVADFAAPGADGLYPRAVTCLTMWYVIEHFDALARVLRRVASLLKPGGVFAFSTPSASGISARKDLAAFLENSPDDHFTVWSPETAPAILKRFGFRVQRIVITGHHPERFPWVPASGRTLRHGMAWLASRAFGLGDTFECYAVLDTAMPSASD
jgi:2-polyprenyl-3-methyl-5-hydroxy-6-metoxy-1,4-benzoquinol methylase